jgi:Flp pilus assembly protein TadB
VTAALAIVAALLVLAATPWPTGLISSLARRLNGRRDRELRAALPTLVDTLAAALGSGLSLSLAFAEVAPTLPPLLGGASRRSAAALALGARVEEALGAYDEIVPADELAPVTIVLSSFARSGGRVGASLERVARLLRARLALEEERSALTAQARASAFVLVALAPLGATFFTIAMPDYLPTLIGAGAGLLGLAFVFEIVGAAWLWRIVRGTVAPVDLANFLDAVVVGLDAGLTFERALAVLVERSSAFGRVAEARRLLADIALGTSLPDALRTFATRPDEARVAALVAAATRFGSPLAPLLVLQSEALRSTERHRAEATARRLPVLMLFPLTFCILPALLIVFLGPPLLALLH